MVFKIILKQKILFLTGLIALNLRHQIKIRLTSICGSTIMRCVVFCFEKIKDKSNMYVLRLKSFQWKFVETITRDTKVKSLKIKYLTCKMQQNSFGRPLYIIVLQF